MKRRSTTGDKIQELIDDFSTLTEHEDSNWIMHYRGEEQPWSVEAFKKVVPQSPAEYREQMEGDLNEMRHAAGLKVKQIYEREADIKALQAAAGLL
jgi:hypothetical protein